MSDQQWLVLRTQEIIAKSEEISGRDAVKAALRERFAGNFDQLLDFAATATNVLRKLKNSTYNLPADPTLFDVPQTIAVNTDEGPLFVTGDQRELGHVRSWAHDGLQHHSAQRYRFSRVVKDLKQLDDRPDELAWDEVRHELTSGEGSPDAE